MTSENLPQLPPLTVSVDQVRRLSGLGSTTVWALIRDGDLETVKVGRRILVRYESVQRLLTPPKHEAA